MTSDPQVWADGFHNAYPNLKFRHCLPQLPFETKQVHSLRATAMSRYPPVSPSDFSPEQEAVYKETSSLMDQHFRDKFIYKDGRKALVGPFGPLMHTPAVAHAYNKLILEITKTLNVTLAVRETAIIATGSTFKAGYELYAHTTIAAKDTKLTERQILLIKDGQKPEEEDQLDAACDVAFDMAIELSGKPGSLSEGTWKRACDVFGKDSTLAMINLIAFYAYACILMNGADVPVPE